MSVPVSLATDTGIANIAAFIEQSAARFPSRAAILDGAGMTSYADLAAQTHRAAAALSAAGCRPGDRVLLALPDSVRLVAAFFGAARLGAVAVAVSPQSGEAEFCRYLPEVTPRVVIAAPATASAATAAAARHGGTGRIVTDAEWDGMLIAAHDPVEMFVAGPTDPAAFVYTSGSTARQKAAVHSHHNFAVAVRNVAEAVFGFGPGDRILCVSKLTFSFGMGFGMYFPLATGATTILNGAPTTLENVAALIARDRPTVLAAVPSFLSSLIRASKAWLPIDLSSLRFIVSAGEPLPEAVRCGFAERHGVEVIDGIGSTELMTHFISNRPGQVHPKSAGTAVPSCDIELRDDDGRVVPAGQVGALWVRSDSAFLHYWGQPELTARTLVQGWVRTGDLMTRDTSGAYTYCGRRDDAVKVSGVWVSSQDVEQAVAAHPDVERALVTTRQDPAGTDRLVAYIETRSGASGVSGLRLLQFLADRLPELMIPAAVVVVDRFPLTPNGKIARGALPEPDWPRRRVVKERSQGLI